MVNKKIDVFSKITSQLLELIDDNKKTNKLIGFIQAELQSVEGELRNSIDATKQEVVKIKETNKDMIKLLSHPVLPPIPYSEVLGKTLCKISINSKGESYPANAAKESST
ncbi:hypothetical protein JTB14_023793 [Gonioctena quinquepunctata]|nr:hypothetical protein JTB14_023793 [Gonioctena quinquepunctata]